MKLRNKKTGEIDDYIFEVITDRIDLYKRVDYSDNKNVWHYNSLAELNADWEDAPEEPKEYWYIENNGDIDKETYEGDEYEEEMIEIGNYFETKEEAEKAVEKLKALTRLKDEGMMIYSFEKAKPGIDLDFYTLTILAPRDKDSLDLLFGGEE